MTVILCNLKLEDLITKGILEPKEAGRPMATEAKVIADMTKKDAKARTQIELAVGDSEMIHLLGTTTAKAMWDQLQTVKETQGRLGILLAHHMLFQYSADEMAFDMASHIMKLRRMQEELHLIGSVVHDNDFAMILLTSQHFTLPHLYLKTPHGLQVLHMESTWTPHRLQVLHIDSRYST